MASARRGNAPVEIHHDGDDSLDEDDHLREERVEVDDEDMQDDGYSMGSMESDGAVESAVQEDMDKFRETFKGIEERFRLINRIGEGKVVLLRGVTVTDAA